MKPGEGGGRAPSSCEPLTGVEPTSERAPVIRAAQLPSSRMVNLLLTELTPCTFFAASAAI
jgi:hypothetical protein